MTIPLALTISVLVLGLSKYYSNNNNNKDEHDATETKTNTTGPRRTEPLSTLNGIKLNQQVGQNRQQEIDQNEDNYNIDKRNDKVGNTDNHYYAFYRFANIPFVGGYTACLLIVTAYFFIFSPSNDEIFVPWEHFTIVNIIELGASIALCFFLPGYAILDIVFRDPDHQIRPILKLLLAYLLSIIVTGLTGYIMASVGFGLSDYVGLFIAVYSSILFVLLIRISLSYRDQKDRPKYYFRNLSLKKPTFELIKHPVWNFLKGDNAGLIVFASLFALVILSTYFLYSGAIIGDQWYHHGRSLAFMSGEFRDIATAGADIKTFSPFPSALLAAFFSISGTPSVNAYASISFLNIITVLAFYYFFKNWVPVRMKKAALLACTLFMLGSGFGWVYVLELAVSHPPESQLSALQMMYQAGIKSLDIILPTSFVGVAHPDFSTPLVIMALPAGFTMLGILREQITKDRFKLKYFAILLLIILLGIISHDEFYLFIIIASTIPIYSFFTTKESENEKKRNFVVVYGALLGALLLTLILGTYSFEGAGYFIYNTIVGMPLIVLCFIFVAVTWILHTAIRFFYDLSHQKEYRSSHLHFKSLLLSQPWINYLHGDGHKTVAPLVIVFIIAWLYVFTFIVWDELSVEAVEIQTHDYTVPWYLYPMKLGVTGLLGFAFVLSYLFRIFEKEVCILGIMVVIAFVTGPYYDEQRFSKYVMAGMAGFGSLFIYNIILKSPHIRRNNQYRVLVTSLILGIVTFSSTLSVFMFWAYNASALDSDFDKELGRRDFPSASEFGLFNFLRNSSKNPLAFNVAAPASEYSFHTGDLIGKIHAFSGIPWTKLTQSPLTLNASTLEGFYDLLHRTDIRYIVLPKENFISHISELVKDEEIERANRDKQQKEEEGDNGRQRQYEATIKDEHTSITGILRFALESFQKIYEDGEYLVLEVPPLTSPRFQGDIGLIIPRSGLFLSSLLPDTNNTLLHYNNYTFKKEEIDKLAGSGKIQFATTNSILHGEKGEITTLWSNPLKQLQMEKANYIEATFRITGENTTSNDAGIIWNDRNQEYTASVRNDRLEILVKPIDGSSSEEPSEKKLVNVREIKREKGVWYTLKIITLEEYVNVYINDMLAVQVSREGSQFHSKPYRQVASENTTSNYSYPNISRVGLFSFNNIAEFKPIEIGHVPLQLYEKDRVYFEHYYPLNMLSLSKLNYDTFLEGDLSVFSKKIIVVDMASFLHLQSSLMDSTDVKSSTNSEDENQDIKYKAIDYDNSENNKLLEFAKKGGTLIITNIVNPDSNYFPNQDIFHNTELGKVFSIQAGDKVKFDQIAQNNGADLSTKPKKQEIPQQLYLNVSGVVQDIEIENISSPSSDFKVISSYMRNNNEVAPFAFEKKYGAGKITVVNSGGYFNAVASSPKQYFHSLAMIPRLLDLGTVSQDNNRVVTDNAFTSNAIPIARVAGDMKVSGNSLINSSSLSIYGNKILNDTYRFDNDEFHVQSIISSLSDKGSKSRNSSNTSDTEQILQNNNHTISNAVIRDLRLTGKYEVIISFNGSLVLPSKMGSYYDYIAAYIPTGFNMIVKLHDEATAEFIVENGPHGQSIRLTGNTKVNFYNVSDAQDKKDISVLLKSPQIRVIDGITNFEKLFMYDPYSRLAGDGGLLLNFKGDMLAKFDYVDNYDETDSSGGWTHTQPLSYLKSIHFSKDNNYNNDKKINLEFPADISPLAKKEGGVVPVQSALLSEKNIVVSIFITAVAVALLTIRMYRRPQRLGLK